MRTSGRGRLDTLPEPRGTARRPSPLLSPCERVQAWPSPGGTTGRPHGHMGKTSPAWGQPPTRVLLAQGSYLPSDHSDAPSMSTSQHPEPVKMSSPVAGGSGGHSCGRNWTRWSADGETALTHLFARPVSSRGPSAWLGREGGAPRDGGRGRQCGRSGWRGQGADPPEPPESSQPCRPGGFSPARPGSAAPTLQGR